MSMALCKVPSACRPLPLAMARPHLHCLLHHHCQLLATWPHPSPTSTAPQGAALSSNVILFKKDSASGQWATKTVIKQAWADVEGWALPRLPPLITDILLSLDDRFLYFSNWLRGGWRQGQRAAAEAL